jgi:uncharacterized protein YdeI (YjbR/CyaY-like superfamily)
MPTNPDFNPKVDLYIAQAKPFAQPILEYLRELIHQACPGVQESIKWSRPFFEYKGQILGNISAFNAHCSFGFWGQEIGAVLRDAKVLQEDGMGSLGKITVLEDLPSKKQLLQWLRQAKGFIDSGAHTSPIAARKQVVKAPKPQLPIPPEFEAALKSHPSAQQTFRNFAPSCQREYLEWFAEAKQQTTKDKRIAQAIEWLKEGKQRHWKYQTAESARTTKNPGAAPSSPAVGD